MAKTKIEYTFGLTPEEITLLKNGELDIINENNKTDVVAYLLNNDEYSFQYLYTWKGRTLGIYSPSWVEDKTIRKEIRKEMVEAVYKYPIIINNISTDLAEFVVENCPNIAKRYAEYVKKNPEIILDTPRPICKSSEFVEALFNDEDFISRLEPDWYDKLPYGLHKEELVKKAFNRGKKVYTKKGIDKEGYNFEWIDSTGEFKKFFELKENFPIKDKDDYSKIFETYIRSGLSNDQFCAIYGISDYEGFRAFIDRMGAENLTNYHRVKEVRTEVSRKFFESQIRNIRAIYNDEMTFEEFFSNNTTRYDLSLEHLLEYFDETEANVIVKKFLEYSNTMPKDYLLTKYIRVLGIEKMNLDFIKKAVNELRKYLILPADVSYSRICAILIKEIDKHSKGLSRQMIHGDINAGGIEYTIDDELINKAVSYTYKNKIHPSTKVILNLCKKIALGEISLEEETIEYDPLAEKINVLITEERDIDDYLNLMEEESTIIRR